MRSLSDEMAVLCQQIAGLTSSTQESPANTAAHVQELTSDEPHASTGSAFHHQDPSLITPKDCSPQEWWGQQ